MTREGEEEPAAPYSWRLRLSSGFLFVLAGLGVVLASPSSSPAAPFADLGRPDAFLRSGTLLWPAALAAAALLADALAARRARRAVTLSDADADADADADDDADLDDGDVHHTDVHHSGAPERDRGGEPPGAAPLPALAPARELLALFAHPRPAAGERVAEAEQERTAAEPPAARAERSRAVPMIRLYGPLSIVGARGRGLGQRPVRGLIVYLLLRGGGATADELAAALWPDEELNAARRRAWDAARRARALLGDALVRQGSRYVLDRGRVRVDATEAEAGCASAAGLAQVEQALSLTSGEPLADVDYTFADGERRRLAAVRLELLARAAVARLAAGDAAAARLAAEALVAHEPLDERGWRLAMEADGALGARRALIDRYARLARSLDRQLGLRPQAETQATYRRLLGQN